MEWKALQFSNGPKIVLLYSDVRVTILNVYVTAIFDVGLRYQNEKCAF